MAESTSSEKLAIYNLAVEMADRNSSRRITANSFYLTLQGALIAGFGIFITKDQVSDQDYVSTLIFAGLGILLCIAWLLTIKSYGDLASAKWGVILKIEEQLPIKPFSDEWELLDTDEYKKWRKELRNRARPKRLYKWLRERNKYYTPQSKVERFIPTTLIFGYLAVFIYGVLGLW